jgi:hypothetical protein
MMEMADAFAKAAEEAKTTIAQALRVEAPPAPEGGGGGGAVAEMMLQVKQQRKAPPKTAQQRALQSMLDDAEMETDRLKEVALLVLGGRIQTSSRDLRVCGHCCLRSTNNNRMLNITDMSEDDHCHRIGNRCPMRKQDPNEWNTWDGFLKDTKRELQEAADAAKPGAAPAGPAASEPTPPPPEKRCSKCGQVGVDASTCGKFAYHYGKLIR